MSTKIKNFLIRNKFKILIGFSLIAITAGMISVPLALNSEHIYLKIKNKHPINLLGMKPNYSNNIDNSLENDAIQKTKLNEPIVYYVTNNGVFHRFGFLSHLIKTLELNPNQQIYIFLKNKNWFNFDFLNQYPNVHIKYSQKYDHLYCEGDNINNLNNKDFEEFVAIVEKLDKFHFYCPDFFLLFNIKRILINLTKNYNYQYLQKITANLNKLSFLYKAQSINMFSDGTLSYDYLDNDIYNFFLKFNFNFNDANKAYDYFKNQILNNHKLNFYYLEEVFYFIYSLIVSKQSNNNFTKTKYFFPSIQMINEINAKDTPVLDLNNQNNDYFNPYNTLNAGFIQIFEKFTPQSLQNFYIAMKKPNFHPDAYNNLLNDKINYIYSGRLLADLNQTDLITEAQKVIYLYQTAIEDTPPNDVNKIQIIYKGHPRESLNIVETLTNEIKKINPDLKPENWLKVIDPTIPYELYLISGVFLKNNVKLFQTYSTIALFLYDYNKCINVSKYLLNQKENNEINNVFGKNSKIFQNNKRVLF